MSGSVLAGVSLFEFGVAAHAVAEADEHFGFGFVLEVEPEPLVEGQESLVADDGAFESSAVALEFSGGGFPGESSRSEVSDIKEKVFIDVFKRSFKHDTPCEVKGDSRSVNSHQ